MRLIFIHGFGESPAVFDKIAKQLPGTHTYVDLWVALGEEKRPALNLLDFARELVKQHDIAANDMIIGHSLGGKIALHIKQVNGNRIIQLASWTDQRKVLLPIKNTKLLIGLARMGFMFSRVNKWFMLKQYRRPDTIAYYEEAFNRLIKGHHHCSVNQLRLVLEPISEEVTAVPDLRIHARRDNIIRYPDEEYFEVPGDHFSLLTHPAEVSAHIQSFL